MDAAGLVDDGWTQETEGKNPLFRGVAPLDV